VAMTLSITFPNSFIYFPTLLDPPELPAPAEAVLAAAAAL
jgi:hypothetical protein